jgi:hypothetical protein
MPLLLKVSDHHLYRCGCKAYIAVERWVNLNMKEPLGTKVPKKVNAVDRAHGAIGLPIIRKPIAVYELVSIHLSLEQRNDVDPDFVFINVHYVLVLLEDESPKGCLTSSAV